MSEKSIIMLIYFAQQQRANKAVN